MPVAVPRVTYLNHEHTVASWLLTKDHKRIGIMYLMVVTFAFFLGGLFATMIRLELATPAGDLVSADTYNKMFTMHGVAMVFFVLIPAVPAILGNFVLPLMLGAKDVAFPKLNLLSWYIFVIGFLFTVYAMVAGGVDTGWTFYTPYSSRASNTNVMATGLGVFITGFSSILTGLNFMVTIHRMRAPGLTWFRLPLFVWAIYATSLVQILGTPVIAITVLALAVERFLHFGIFDPVLGGDPVLFQHMFWFYSHPAVYIMILPPMGAISEVIAAFSRKSIFGYSFVAFSSLAIAIFGFLVWAHHMFVSGISRLLCAGVLLPDLCGRDSVGGQDIQLGRDVVSRSDLAEGADDLGHLLSRAVPHRGTDGSLHGGAGRGRAPPRHLLHRRALPLHHGRRRDHGLLRRPALLVAEDDRADVLGYLGQGRLDHRVRGVQPDVRPSVHPRVSRHASPVPRVSG